MRTLTTTLLLVLTCAAPLARADTLRCGSQLVSLDDRRFEVLQKCGDPAFRDVVGYALSANERREYQIEEWVYGPSNGMLSILTFEGSRLRAIERRRNR
ncbi:MAG: DUF2845 domain-containing protein [Pseudomonas sp.]|nr:DUF2845 domain-containing protein [Pseudomonas sp.]